jgi:hypothetical protein
MSKSVEASVLEAVIEGDIERAARQLSADGAFFQIELISLADSLGKMLDLVNAELAARRRGSARPAADTGSVNIIRGRD